MLSLNDDKTIVLHLMISGKMLSKVMKESCTKYQLVLSVKVKPDVLHLAFN